MESQTYQIIGAALLREYRSAKNSDDARRIAAFIKAYEAAPLFMVGFSPTRNYEYDELAEVYIQPEHITRLAEGHVQLDNIRMPFPHVLFEIPVGDISNPSKHYYRRYYDDGIHPIDPEVCYIEPVPSFEVNDTSAFAINSRAIASVHEISPHLLHIEVLYYKSSKGFAEKKHQSEVLAKNFSEQFYTTREMLEIAENLSDFFLFDTPLSVFSSVVSIGGPSIIFEGYRHGNRNPWKDERFADPEDYKPFSVMPLIPSFFNCQKEFDTTEYDFPTHSVLTKCKRSCASSSECRFFGSRSFNWAERVLSILSYINQPHLYIVKESNTVTDRETQREKNKNIKKKLPTFYHKARHVVLDYSQVKILHASSTKGGTHASPIPHKRRGHPRTLKADRFKEKKTIQVKPADVNPGLTWSIGKRIYEVI
jgi:hypothetical protein